MSYLSSLLGRFLKISSSSKEELEAYKKANYNTHVNHLGERVQVLLRKDYDEKGFYLSTIDVVDTKWLVGMKSKINSTGYPYCFWDLSTCAEYNKSMKMDILVNNKPEVFGDIHLNLMDSGSLSVGSSAPDYLKSIKLKFLYFTENIGLRMTLADFEKQAVFCDQHKKGEELTKVLSIFPKICDVSACIRVSILKLSAEGAYVLDNGQSMSGALTNCSVGLAMDNKDFVASLICSRSLLTGSYLQRCALGNWNFDLGFELSKKLSFDHPQCTWTLGGSLHKSHTFFKGKINQVGEISGCMGAELWRDAFVSLSCQVDSNHLLQRPNPKFGFKVVLKSKAVEV